MITLEKILDNDPDLSTRLRAIQLRAETCLHRLKKNGFPHCRNVIRNLDKLIPVDVKEDMSRAEIFVLLCASYLHDLGRLYDETHHECSGYEEVTKNFQKYCLENKFEGKAVAEVKLGL